jgi:tetratricopeptide (TPR) repeat protein
MVASVLTVSCSDDRINKILDYAENIVVSRPDSALILLDSIKNPYNQTNFQRARHKILTLYAKDLSFKDISLDTMIFQTIDYLKTANNPKYLALAEYCLGRIYQAQDKNDRALQLYLNAKVTAESSDNDNIKGLIYFYIGQQYYIQRKYDEAIDNFKSALEYFSKSKDNYKRVMAVLNKLGSSFLIANKKDSAMTCYNEALQYAKIAQDSAGIMQNRGAAHLMLNELDNAKQQLLQSLKLNSDSTLQSQIYLNLSKVYEKERMTDSIVYFANLALQFTKDNNYTLANINNILSNVERERGNYEKACRYYKQYTNCIIKTYNNIHKYNILETEAKHKLNVFQNKHATYKLRSTILYIILLAGIILLSILSYRMKRKFAKTINAVLAKTQSEMKSLEESTAVTLEKFNKELSETKDILKKTQFKLNEKENLTDLQLKVLNKIYDVIDSTTKQDIQDLKGLRTYFKAKVFDIYYKWEDIYNAEKPVFDKIQKMYPQLNKTEYKIACLDYMEYTNLMISFILSITSIAQFKTKIRSKIGIESEGNISKFIAEKIELDTDLEPESGL